MIDSSNVGDYEFTSSSTVAELKFDVVNMTATDDFRSFGFEASVEFVRLESECKDSHHLTGASGELSLIAELDGPPVHTTHTSSYLQTANQNRLTDSGYVRRIDWPRSSVSIVALHNALKVMGLIPTIRAFVWVSCAQSY